MNTNSDVLILGGGPAGATQTIRRYVKVKVYRITARNAVTQADAQVFLRT